MLTEQFHQALAECPLVAIIRGVQPHEVERVGGALLEAGIRAIEVPLNSPDPLTSIERLARLMDGHGICGAGTVLTPEQVQDVQNAGGQIIVSPNCDQDVINATLQRGLVSTPGCLTPTEAFAALKAGTNFLKLFPVADFSPAYVKSLHAVLPENVTTLAVGGIDLHNMADFWAAGIRGFGLGSNLYRAGDTAATVMAKASALVAASQQLSG